MSYKKVINLPDLRNFQTFTEKIEFDEQEENFSTVRVKGRYRAIEQLNVSNQAQATAIVDVDAKGFDRYRITDEHVIDQIAEQLGLKKPSARVQILPPGRVTLLHLDDLGKGYMYPVEEHLRTIDFTPQELENFNNDPRTALRFLIMLEDSMPGQLMLFGDKVISSWSKGDVIYWDWPTVAHSTINTGYWPRALLRISGLASDKTWEIINNANSQ